ncbi:MAG: hypothetical protein A2284_15830 [Deltaproteobacteria bacterium RIFOXYA12_FULL_61_11]|nr:MAG: hypothetical protein A2284_15830 [Deltaproteobacteria bacterium RIFOXYA12_FULL_61_11]
MDFYQKHRKSVSSWLGAQNIPVIKNAEYLLLGTDLSHLVLRLALEKKVPLRKRADYVLRTLQKAEPKVLKRYWAGDEKMLKNLLDLPGKTDELAQEVKTRLQRRFSFGTPCECKECDENSTETSTKD